MIVKPELSVRDSYTDVRKKAQLPAINRNEMMIRANSEAKLATAITTSNQLSLSMGKTAKMGGQDITLANAVRTYQRGQLGDNSVLTLMNGSTSNEKIRLKSMLN